MAALAFDDRDGWIWLDGRLVPWREAKAHVLTHGLHYGSSVFEGERAYGGEIFKSTQHSERLKQSARILDFEIPYSVAEIDAAKAAVLARNNLTDAYLRPVAWRGSQMMSVGAPNGRIHLAIAAWDWPSYFDPAQRMKGLRLDIADYRRPDPRTAPSLAKASGLYMICTISRHRAERRGYADAMMLDWEGRVAECTARQYFLRQGGRDPYPDRGRLPRRDHPPDRSGARAPSRHAAFERRILPEELAGFSECFITGSAAEVTPVSEIGPYRFAPGAQTRTLVDDYCREVQPKSRAA